MKKTVLTLLGLCFALTVSMGQQSRWMQKYWNYRDRFHKYFVHLGTNPGDGLPAAHRPLKRYNDFPYYVSGTSGYNGMKFGDVTADLGDYIAVLATEYKLLKDAGKDLTPTLNELYFALDAFERSDREAEFYLSGGGQGSNSNGFFMRGDVPENYHQIWNNEYANTQDEADLRLGGIDAPGHHTGQSPAYLNQGNEMSQDQVIGLFVGFSFIKKFVDNVAVSPRPGVDPPRNLVTQAEQITERILSYAETVKTYEQYVSAGSCGTEHKTSEFNWEINNPVTFEAVKSGGGNFQGFAYPMQCTRNFITGGNYSDVNLYAHLRFDYSGTFCPTVGGDIWINYPKNIWNDIPNLNFNPNGFTTPDYDLCINVPIVNIDKCWTIIPSFQVNVKDYNINMALSLAATAAPKWVTFPVVGIINIAPNWTQAQIASVSDAVDMEIFDLVYATLHDVSPILQKNMYEQILASAPEEGPYWYDASDNSPGWIENSRWSHPHNVPSDAGGKMGNDYMWLYNLYRIAYANYQDVSSVQYGEQNTCAYQSCPAIFKNIVGSDLVAPTAVARKFQNYMDFGVTLKEYLNQSLNIISANDLNLLTELVVCNNSGVQSVVQVQNGGHLVLGEPSGDNYKKGILRIKAGHKLLLRSGSTLTINDKSIVIIEPGAFIEIEPGSIIELIGNLSLLDASQGTLTNITLNNNEQITFTNAAFSTGGGVARFNGNGTAKITMNPGSNITNEYCKVYFDNTQFEYNNVSATLPEPIFYLNGAVSWLDIKHPNQQVINITPADGFKVLKTSAAIGGTLNLTSTSFNGSINESKINHISNGEVYSDNCRIYLNDYDYYYHPDANINLNGDDACLRFGRYLHLLPNADLKFFGTGYFGFNLHQDWVNWKNVYGNATNTITLIGANKDDKIVAVTNAHWVNPMDEISMITIKNGHVDFGSNATISIGSSYEYKNLKATGQGMYEGGGFMVGGQSNHIVENIDFYDLQYPLRAYSFWTQGSNLKATDITFTHCENGIIAWGKGISVFNMTATQCILPITGNGMDSPSLLYNLGTYDSEKVINFSTAGLGSLTIKHSTVREAWQSVFFEGANFLNIRCSDFEAWGTNNSTSDGIVVSQGASLNLTPLTGGVSAGLNNLSWRAGIKFIGAKDLYLNGGYNDLSVIQPWDPSYPTGSYTLSGDIHNMNCKTTLNADNNIWEQGNSNNPNVIHNYDLYTNYLTSGCHHSNITINDLAPKSNFCVIEPPDPLPDRWALDDCRDCPIVTSEHFDNTPLNEAVKIAISNTTMASNEDGDDLLATKMFNDILQVAADYDNIDINWLSNLSYTYMKQTVASAIATGRIVDLNFGEEHIAKLVEVINRQIEKARETDNDFAEFYAYFDLASIYRTVGERNNSIEILSSLPHCLKLDEGQISYLYKMINQFTAEQMVLDGTLNIMEFDSYVASGNRSFLKYNNTQANIDTIQTDSTNAFASIQNLQSVSDLAGNIYTVSTANDSTINYKIVKTNLQNEIVWEQQYNGKQNGIDSVKAIAIDANAFIYVTGKSWNGLNYDIVTLKYDSAGNSYWTAVYNDLNIGNDEPTGIAIDTAFKIVMNAVSYNDSVTVYKQIYYSQCDTNCVPTFRVRQLKAAEHNFFGVKIQPNPAKDVCAIDIRSNLQDDVFKLELYDITGKKIFDSNISTHFNLNVAEFKRGVYQAVVSNRDGKLKKQRVVLQ